jgi:thymidylate kinase
MGEGLVVDEGVLQRLAYVLAATGAPHSPEVERPEVLPRVDGVIALDLPLDLAVSRVRERALTRSWEFQSTEVMPAMATALAHIAQVLGDNGVPMLTVDASKEVADERQRVRAFLAELART